LLLTLTEDQSLLERAAADFVSRARPISLIRASMEANASVPADYRRHAAEFGWSAFLVPESAGGGLDDPADALNALVLATVSGRHLQPTEFVTTSVVAATLAGSSRSVAGEWLSMLLSGERRAAWAFAAPGVDSAESLALPADAHHGELRLTARAFTHEVDEDDVILVSVDAGDRIAQYLVPASHPSVTVLPAISFDLTTRHSEIRFDDLALLDAQCLGEYDETALRRQLDLAIVLCLADAVGSMNRLLEMTVEYALVRKTFGRLIGSYQALKHQLADASFAVVSSECVTAAVADALVADHPDLSEVVSIAKSWVSDRAHEVAQTCLQVHGGIGFAWEHDLHLYYRRLAAASAAYGTATYHRDWIARHHLPMGESVTA
jgi:alkylation response protein AidB-like acyl-CoA dehydrogenase